MIQSPASKSHKQDLAVLLGGLVPTAAAYATLRGEQVELASQITARVSAIMVREGDAVSAGQLLLQFDSAEWQASVAQAQAQAESRLRPIREASLPLAEQTPRQAEANARQIERHHQRVSDGFYSPAQLDDVERARDVARC